MLRHRVVSAAARSRRHKTSRRGRAVCAWVWRAPSNRALGGARTGAARRAGAALTGDARAILPQLRAKRRRAAQSVLKAKVKNVPRKIFTFAPISANSPESSRASPESLAFPGKTQEFPGKSVVFSGEAPVSPERSTFSPENPSFFSGNVRLNISVWVRARRRWSFALVRRRI